ncbi:hypothetical protein LTR78_010670 [Recurvomyces mirabilis]|uniref:non-specific serine/threonine protein kinase n=1 Tax=Recurvomyces mirabilis TaxID=574656 RepID=A0AAE0TLP0_9PEZI|nr:hypothetical protein LTR78_010670 [Recurvomyces mirabilis]
MDGRDAAISWSNVKTLQNHEANGRSTAVAQQRLQASILANRLKDLERSLELQSLVVDQISSISKRSEPWHRPSARHNRLLQIRNVSSDSTPNTSVSALPPSTGPTSLFAPHLHERTFFLNQANAYDILHPLDRPALKPKKSISADIFLVRSTASERLFVEKRIRITEPIGREQVNAEIRALQQIKDRDCPAYINKLFESFLRKDEECCSLILEHCDAGTLEDKINVLSEAGVPPVEGRVGHVIASLAKAIHFCHTGIDVDAPSQARPNAWKTLCHLNIKPASIFLSKDSGDS